MPAAPAAAGVAVCLEGRARTASLSSICTYLVAPWEADAFLVSKEPDAAAGVAAFRASRCGERLKVVRVVPADKLYAGLPLAQLSRANGSWSSSFHAIHRTGYTALGLASQLLTRAVCFAQVSQYEQRARRGQRYLVFARIRMDTLLIERVPPAFVQALGPMDALVPSGEDYCDRCTNDKMLFGRRAAFEADASEWRRMLGEVGRGWIQESLHFKQLAAAGLSVRRHPLAYCIVSERGSCRFGAELSLALDRLNRTEGAAAAHRLLRDHPTLCAGFAAAPCDPARWVQGGLRSDPGFCGLARRCCAAISSPHSHANGCGARGDGASVNSTDGSSPPRIVVYSYN